MSAIRIVGGLLVFGCANVGVACQLPALLEVPSTETIKENAQAIFTEWTTYRDGMQAYITCTQAALQAAGGDNAPALVKAALVKRNNIAVQEYTQVAKAFDERVAPLVRPPPGAAPEPDLSGLDNTIPGQQ